MALIWGDIDDMKSLLIIGGESVEYGRDPYLFLGVYTEH